MPRYKETWAAEKTYCKKIYKNSSKMSYDNFRNQFWNLSTFDSGSQQRYSFYLKKVITYFWMSSIYDSCSGMVAEIPKW